MRKDRKGFTIAELLIATAIIAVLVAVSVPLFRTQLEKSREATDLANVRAAYSAVSAAVLAEDQSAEYQGEKIFDGDDYWIDVPLKQKKAGWDTGSGKLIVGDVAESDQERWFDEPESDGICSVVYESTSGLSGSQKEMHLYWGGKTYNYLTHLISNIVDAFKQTGSRVLNSDRGSGSAAIKTMMAGVTDPKTMNDIQTFAAVKDPDQNDGSYNLIYSTFKITNNGKPILSLRDQKIPAILYNSKTKKFTVGYATVKKAPDSKDDGYNIITVGPNGEYVGNKNNAGYSSYKSESLITSGNTYSNRASAQRAYEKLVQQTLAQHSDWTQYETTNKTNK